MTSIRTIIARIFGPRPTASVAEERPTRQEPRRLSPSELFAAGGGIPNARTAEILRLADESHHRQRQPHPADPDEAVLQMLAGANFGPGARLILPSGKELDPGEAQALTSFYAEDAEDADGSTP